MRRGLVICAIAAASLSTAACGGGGGNALQSVASAATKTAATNSERVHMVMSMSMGPIGPLKFTADGVVDNATKSGDMTLDMSSVATLLGSQAGAADQWKAHMILDGSGAGPVLYMRLPALDQYLNGKTWVKADLASLAQKAGLNLTQLLQTAGGSDPTQALQMLESIGTVSKVGTATIDGVDTTEYSGTIDVKKALAALGDGATGLAKALDEAKVTSIPVDVWIGDDGLVRRLHENFAYAVPNAGELAQDMTIDLSDFGVNVSIQPPPADQTADIGTLNGIGG